MALALNWQSPSGLIHREAHRFEMQTKCGCRIGAVDSGWRPIPPSFYFIPEMRCYRCYPEANRVTI